MNATKQLTTFAQNRRCVWHRMKRRPRNESHQANKIQFRWRITMTTYNNITNENKGYCQTYSPTSDYWIHPCIRYIRSYVAYHRRWGHPINVRGWSLDRSSSRQVRYKIYDSSLIFWIFRVLPLEYNVKICLQTHNSKSIYNHNPHYFWP